MPLLKTGFISGIILSALFMLQSCDQEFNPLQENDYYLFSVNGYLNVHADTQWVRVMPIGTELNPSDESNPPALVTLSRHSDGKIVTLKDSLFRFNETVFVRNYYTTESILPEENYILTAENKAGEQSTASITTPSAIDSVDINWRVNVGIGVNGGTIEGNVQNKIAFSYITYRIIIITDFEELPPIDVNVDISDKIFPSSNGDFRAQLDHSRAIRDELDLGFSVNYRVLSRTFVLTTVTEDWPFDGDIGPGDQVFPKIGSNVTNGTGYVSGVSKIEQTIVPTFSN